MKLLDIAFDHVDLISDGLPCVMKGSVNSVLTTCGFLLTECTHFREELKVLKFFTTKTSKNLKIFSRSGGFPFRTALLYGVTYVMMFKVLPYLRKILNMMILHEYGLFEV